MKMFLTFIFLLCPMVAHAVVAPEYCDSFTSTPDTCKNTAGCLYNDALRKCIQCPENTYCPNNHNNQPQDCSRTSFPQSDKGSTSEEECFKDQIACKKNDDSDDNQCRHYNTTNDPYRCGNNHNISAHIENGQCYYNTRNCNLFDAVNCPANQTSGTAQYFAQSGYMPAHWNIGSCECDATEFTDSETRFCHGIQSGATPSIPVILNITTPITYNDSNTYYCTRCINDNDNNKYYANLTYTNGTQCSPDTANGRVCKCETSTYRGHYRKGKCNSNDNWSDTGSDICTRVACDIPGTNTTELLPISTDNSVCKYTPQTQFCDAKGCFTLPDAGDWTITP